MTAPRAFVVTGPTSGMGHATALALAAHGTVVLVGRDPARLATVEAELAARGGRTRTVVCDLSDVVQARRAAAEVAGLGVPIAGVLNNAGVQLQRPAQSAQGWDLTFATNHLGPFVFTEALLPHLADGAHVLFVGSAVEDPGRRPAVAAGFRGARYLSAEASARGEWLPGGSRNAWMDAYATSKQATMAAALALAREVPRLRINTVEPGFNPATGLGGREGSGAVRFVQRFVVPVVVPLLAPFVKILTTSARAGRVLSGLLVDPGGRTGTYFDEGGAPMQGSEQLHDPAFQDRVLAETRALVASRT